MFGMKTCHHHYWSQQGNLIYPLDLSDTTNSTIIQYLWTKKTTKSSD